MDKSNEIPEPEEDRNVRIKLESTSTNMKISCISRNFLFSEETLLKCLAFAVVFSMEVELDL